MSCGAQQRYCAPAAPGVSNRGFHSTGGGAVQWQASKALTCTAVPLYARSSVSKAIAARMLPVQRLQAWRRRCGVLLKCGMHPTQATPCLFSDPNRTMTRLAAAATQASPFQGVPGSGSAQAPSPGPFTRPAPAEQAPAAQRSPWQPGAAAGASSPLMQTERHSSATARRQLDLGAGSSNTAMKSDPASVPLPGGAAACSAAPQGPSLPLTPGTAVERPPAAPSSASPVLLRRPAAAVGSTPAPGRAAAATPPGSSSQPASRQETAAAPVPPSPALLEARAGVQEADALLRQAHAQRRQLWELADRLMAAERGGRREAERALWEAQHQVRAGGGRSLGS